MFNLCHVCWILQRFPFWGSKSQDFSDNQNTFDSKFWTDSKSWRNKYLRTGSISSENLLSSLIFLIFYCVNYFMIALHHLFIGFYSLFAAEGWRLIKCNVIAVKFVMFKLLLRIYFGNYLLIWLIKLFSSHFEKKRLRTSRFIDKKNSVWFGIWCPLKRHWRLFPFLWTFRTVLDTIDFFKITPFFILLPT